MALVSQNALPACAVTQSKARRLWNSFPNWNPNTPPLAASFFISQSGMFRGISLTARIPWCVAITGTLLASIAAEIASSEACDTLITIPSRFISRITARPRSFNPCHFGGEQHESA